MELPKTCVDPASHRELLEGIQGNLLKGHGRDHAIYLFFSLTGSKVHARRGVGELAAQFVTSAWEQHLASVQYRALKLPGGLFGSLMLSWRAYEKLGETRSEDHFVRGMADYSQSLDDPDPSLWEPGYRQVEGVLLLADDDAHFLRRMAANAAAEIARFGRVEFAEHGHVRRNADGDGIEHFGFVDGLSQPVLLTTDLKPGQQFQTFDPREPPGLVLVEDPFAPGEYGSYGVFRKLEQNVRGFKQAMAAMHAGGAAHPQLPEAMVVGRFKDGTPLALSQQPQAALLNDFDYANDPQGTQCPWSAHARKMNPRTNKHRNRIARRGIPYGERKEPDLPETGVGLLFLCFQRAIGVGFFLMQKKWANAPDFPQPGAGLDALIGQPAAGNAMARFITLKGGEFLFAPSLKYFERLRDQ